MAFLLCLNYKNKWDLTGLLVGSEDGVFLTDEQRHYYNAVKKIASTTPKKPVPRPRNKFSNKVWIFINKLDLVLCQFCHRKIIQKKLTTLDGK